MEIHRSSQLFSDMEYLGSLSFGSLKDLANSTTTFPLANNSSLLNSSGSLFPLLNNPNTNTVQQENPFSLRTLQLSEDFTLPNNNNTNNNLVTPFTLSGDGWGFGLGSSLGSTSFTASTSNVTRLEPQQNDKLQAETTHSQQAKETIELPKLDEVKTPKPVQQETKAPSMLPSEPHKTKKNVSKKKKRKEAEYDSDDDFGEETDTSETGAMDWYYRSRHSERTRTKSSTSSPDMEMKPQSSASSSGVQIVRDVTCHQCRNRKNTLASCTNVDCTKRYCEGCLRNHYNLDTAVLVAQGVWSCPFCRNSCNCLTCKRTRGEEPEYRAMQPTKPKTQKVKKTKQSHQLNSE